MYIKINKLTTFTGTFLLLVENWYMLVDTW